MQLKSKNILFVFHNNDPFSGATASMLDIVKYLATQRDLSLSAMIPHKEGDLKLVLEELGITVYTGKYYSCRYESNVASFLINTSFFKAAVKSILTAYSVIKFRFTKKLTDFNLIYSNTTDNIWGVLYSLFFGCDHICHVREFGLYDQNQLQVIGDKNYYTLLDRSTSKVISISKSISSYLIEERGIKKEKILEIYDDVGNKVLEFKPRNFNKKISMLMVGNFLEGKGQKFILESAVYLKNKGIDIHIGFVGDDSSLYAESLKQYCAETNIQENITFYGFRRDVKEIRESYNFAVIASASEAFGRVTIEGMMSSQVIIASNVGANVELVKNNVNGILYEYGCKKSFCDTIVRISNSEYDLQLIQKNGFEYSKYFYKNNCGNKILTLIRG